MNSKKKLFGILIGLFMIAISIIMVVISFNHQKEEVKNNGNLEFAQEVANSVSITLIDSNKNSKLSAFQRNVMTGSELDAIRRQGYDVFVKKVNSKEYIKLNGNNINTNNTISLYNKFDVTCVLNDDEIVTKIIADQLEN